MKIKNMNLKKLIFFIVGALIIVLILKIYGAVFPVFLCSQPYLIDYYRSSSNQNISKIEFEKLINEFKKDNWIGYSEYWVENPRGELKENDWKVFYYSGWGENKRKMRAEKYFAAPLMLFSKKVYVSVDYEENFNPNVSVDNPNEKPTEQMISLYIKGGTRFDAWLAYKKVIKNINDTFGTEIQIKSYSKFPFFRYCD